MRATEARHMLFFTHSNVLWLSFPVRRHRRATANSPERGEHSAAPSNTPALGQSARLHRESSPCRTVSYLLNPSLDLFSQSLHQTKALALQWVPLRLRGRGAYGRAVVS